MAEFRAKQLHQKAEIARIDILATRDRRPRPPARSRNASRNSSRNGFGRTIRGVGKEREQLFRRQWQPEFGGKLTERMVIQKNDLRCARESCNFNSNLPATALS
jgi:hypothetical protein